MDTHIFFCEGGAFLKTQLRRDTRRRKSVIKRLLSHEKIQLFFNEVSGYFGFNEPETIKIESSYYSIVREFDLHGEKYYMLINESDSSDMLFRKQLIEDNGDEYLVGLKDKAEVDELLGQYIDEICEVWSAHWVEAPALRLAFEYSRRG